MRRGLIAVLPVLALIVPALALIVPVLLGQESAPAERAEEAPPARAEPNAAPDPDDRRLPVSPFYDQETQEAVERALRWLARQQSPSGSGAIGPPQKYPVAQTSLAALAFLANGSMPDRGPYQRQVYRALEFLVDSQYPDGYITERDERASPSRMHGHGYATLLLAQAFGTNPALAVKGRPLKDVLKQAVRVLERSQTISGGWGYVHEHNTWDEASTTICAIQGLRAAQEAGARVSSQVIDRAQKYVRDCRMETTWTTRDGRERSGYTFRYSLMHHSPRSSFPLTAAAVATLQTSGVYGEETVKGGLAFLDDFFAERMATLPDYDWYDRFIYYSHFYAAQAMFHAPDPKYFADYFPRVRAFFLNNPRYNGTFWQSRSGDGDDVYATAVVALVLQIPLGYLPLFQR